MLILLASFTVERGVGWVLLILSFSSFSLRILVEAIWFPLGQILTLSTLGPAGLPADGLS